MPSATEQRNDAGTCGAKKKSNGEPCRNAAGKGTDHVGYGRCKYHGGSTRNHRTNAVKIEAQKRAAEFGELIEVNPTEALLGVLYLSMGHLAFIRRELAAQDDKRTFDAQVLMRMFDDERDRVARISRAAIESGVAERYLRLIEWQAETVARIMRAILEDPELGLTVTQRSRAPSIARRHLVAADTESERPALSAVPLARR